MKGGGRGRIFFSFCMTFVEEGRGDLPMHGTNGIGNWPRAGLPMKVVGGKPCWLTGGIGEWV